MISVVISYCNNDLQFLEESIIEAKKFTDDICISYCTHSFDGVLEDEYGILRMYEIVKFHKCKAVCSKYEPEKDAKYHHNLLRFIGVWSCENSYVLFLDADEIVNGDEMKKYFDTSHHEEYDAICFQCYWYFRSFKQILRFF
jgi:hypothetical protein